MCSNIHTHTGANAFLTTHAYASYLAICSLGFNGCARPKGRRAAQADVPPILHSRRQRGKTFGSFDATLGPSRSPARCHSHIAIRFLPGALRNVDWSWTTVWLGTSEINLRGRYPCRHTLGEYVGHLGDTRPL